MVQKTKHNQIIIYQQQSSWDQTFCVGWPGMHPLENLQGVTAQVVSVANLKIALDSTQSCNVNNFLVINCCGYYLGNFQDHLGNFFDLASGPTEYDCGNESTLFKCTLKAYPIAKVLL